MLCFGRKRGRKAQITIFLIIGLVILISTGIFFYLKEVGVGGYKIMQPKSAPVENYIEACMKQVGREALDLAGSQGGFTEFPPEIRYDPSRYVFVIPPIPGTADFTPKVPLWWHDGTIKYPSLLMTESEVDRYVEQNLKRCFDNFNTFRNEFDFKEYTNISALTSFNEKDVTIKISYELDIIHRGSDRIVRRNGFVVRLPVRFKRMQEAAQEIIEAAVEQVFFEDATFNLMSAMPDDPPDGLPLTGLIFNCGTLYWDMFKIRQNLMDSLRIVMTGVRFDDTNHLPFRGDEDEYEKFRGAFQSLTTISQNDLDTKDTSEIFLAHIGNQKPPSDAYEYFQLFFDFTEDERRYDDFIVGAEYRQDFGMNFLAIPSSNGKMTSSVADFRHKLMSLFCMNQYHFIYRVRFPMVITVKDPEAYNDDGAVFKFAYLVTIANNEPDKQPRPAEFFEPTEVEPDFCDPINRHGKPVEIIALDETTRLELNRVNISYRCFNSRCYLGETRTNNQRFQLATTLPEGCSKGILYAEKEGYLDEEVQITETPFYLEMHPIINLSYQVMKRRHQPTAIHIARWLEPDEHVAIDIQSNDPKYSFFTDYTEEDKFNLSHSIELVKSDDVSYDLNMYIFKTVNGEDVLTGGWMGNWTPKLSSLKDADKLTLQVVQLFPPPTDYDDTMKMIEVYDLMSNQSNYPDVVPETYAMKATPEEEVEEESTE
ncbi:hypothetical protein ACFL96_15180 [Thermoproteota archaeon]